MTIPNFHLTQEQILDPLRELYRRDLNHRKAIAEYANNFKQRSVFLRNEADFLKERLSLHNIDFNSKGVSPNAPTNHLSYLKTEMILLPVKLLTVELVPHFSQRYFERLEPLSSQIQAGQGFQQCVVFSIPI